MSAVLPLPPPSERVSMHLSPRRQRRLLPLVVGAMLVLAALCATMAKATPDDQERRAAMWTMLSQLQKLMPAVVSDAAWAEADRAELREAAAMIAASSGLIERHALASDTPEARYLSRALTLDAVLLSDRLKEGRRGEARLAVLGAANRCASCHTRLPGARDSRVVMGLRGAAAVDSLPPSERFDLLLATRQFDTAFSVAEEHLVDLSAPLNEQEGMLRKYVVASVRARGALSRPGPHLEAISARGDAWPELKSQLQVWGRTLEDLAAPGAAPKTLKGALKLAETGQRLARRAGDPTGLVHDAYASGVLHRITGDAKAPRGERAKALVGLADIDVRLHGSLPVPLAIAYLEGAIELDPGSATSKLAYGRLEKLLIALYADADGNAVLPDPEQRRLRRMQKLTRSR